MAGSKRRRAVVYSIIATAAIGVGVIAGAVLLERYLAGVEALRELRSADVAARRRAVETLARLRSDSALPHLVAGAREGRLDLDLVEAAILDITGGAPQSATSPFARAVLAWLADQRNGAPAPPWLGGLGRVAHPTISRALETAGAEVRGLQALRWTVPFPEDGVVLVRRGLESKSPDVVRAALSIAGSKHEVGRRVARRIASLVRSATDPVRFEAANALVDLGVAPEVITSWLKEYPRDEDGVSVGAVRLLAQFDPELATTIGAVLVEGDAPARSRAAWALGEIAVGSRSVDPRIVASLHGALADAEPLVRWGALCSLGWLRERIPIDLESVGGLRDDPDLRVRQRAFALFVLSGAPACPEDLSGHVESLLASLASPEPDLRELASEALATLDPPPDLAVRGLLELCEHGDGGALRAALQTIERLGEAAEPALPRIREVLLRGETDDDTQLAAVRALARIGPRSWEAVPELVELLSRWELESEWRQRRDATAAVASAVSVSLLPLRDQAASVDPLIDLLAGFGDHMLPELARELAVDRLESGRYALLVLARVAAPTRGVRDLLEVVVRTSRHLELRQIALLTLRYRLPDSGVVDAGHFATAVEELRHVFAVPLARTYGVLVAGEIATIERRVDLRYRLALINQIRGPTALSELTLRAILRAVEAGFEDDEVISAVRNYAGNSSVGSPTRRLADRILFMVDNYFH